MTSNKNKTENNNYSEEEYSSVEFLNNKKNTIVINIPEDNKKIIYKRSDKERKHVNFFKQFLLPRVYVTAIVSLVVSIIFDLAYIEIINLLVKNPENSNQEAIINELLKKPIFVFITSSIIGPIIEEFIFRKIIFGLLNVYTYKWLAYLVSSSLFAFTHFDFSFSILMKQIYYFPLYFISGCIYAYTYDYDGFILSSMLSHIGYNSLAVILTLYN